MVVTLKAIGVYAREFTLITIYMTVSALVLAFKGLNVFASLVFVSSDTSPSSFY